MAFFSRLKEKLGFGTPVSMEDYDDEYEEEYVEIDPTKDIGRRAKIVVKSFVINDFSDVKEALDVAGTTALNPIFKFNEDGSLEQIFRPKKLFP